jgi:hypothetical protein
MFYFTLKFSLKDEFIHIGYKISYYAQIFFMQYTTTFLMPRQPFDAILLNYVSPTEYLIAFKYITGEFVMISRKKNKLKILV